MKARKPKTKTMSAWVVERRNCHKDAEWVVTGTYQRLPTTVRDCARQVNKEPTQQDLIATMKRFFSRKDTLKRDLAWLVDYVVFYRIRNTKTGETIPAEGLGL